MDQLLQRLARPLAALILLVPLALSACGVTRDSSNNMNAKSYGQDGYMGISNSNPRIPNRNGSFLNYGLDGEFVERKLKEVGGFEKYNLKFRGPNLYVTLTPAPGVDEVQLRETVFTVLSSNMPRYTVHVKTAR
ncbi:hypothetical protein KZ483_00425 [Paenibacillus sp. sptzw28]|uniref:hypothetical protein n=1 Tax=Paenibacillus sp. sptzw28 TaxID=715179 RepID=UPI001C6DDE5A|nr:hypothetical protein [Paenibacillus sp. sptzw28]QYR21568.1 hypothetical protein KZ483_00425 [Paenibacillus sp. sptzw28]